MSLRIFRVVVRGEFSDLDAEVRSDLSAHRAEHDIFLSSYTASGTFTYEERLHAFSLRYEVRIQAKDLGADHIDAEAAARERAEALAVGYLETRSITYKRLRSHAIDMADMWRR